MMATTKLMNLARLQQGFALRNPPRGWALVLVLALWGALGLAVFHGRAAGAEPPVARVVRVYEESRARFLRETNSTEAAWQWGRACFDMADLATNGAQRAAAAQQGIEACRRAVALDPKSAAAHYYLGLNLGQWALTKRLSALHLLKDMETAWKTAVEIDAKYDYAGAHRALGLMYRDAPGWPVALGSRDKARRHLQKAVELAPEYPDNQLNWLETLLDWGEKRATESKLSAVEDVFSAGRSRFTGDAWVLSWQDWDRRWQKIKDRAASKSLKSPRDK